VGRESDHRSVSRVFVARGDAKSRYSEIFKALDPGLYIFKAHDIQSWAPLSDIMS
jgi:hypothetical protein